MFFSACKRFIFYSGICFLTFLGLATIAAEENDLIKAGLKGPVKEVYWERIEFNHEKETSQRIPESRIQYNTTGFVTLSLYYNTYDEAERTIEYIYDNKNRLINKKSYQNGTLYTEDVTTYRKDGSRLEDTYSRNYTTGTMYLSQSAVYVFSGKLLDLKKFRAKETLAFHLSTTSLDSGETIIYVKHYRAGAVVETDMAHYNASGLLNEKSIDRPENKKELHIAWDSNQQIKQVTFTSDQVPGTPLNWEYVYDTKKKLQQIDKYRPDKKIMSRRSFTYKNNKLHKEECVVYDEQQKPHYSWIYFYDHLNNIIKEQYQNHVMDFSYTKYRENSDTYLSESLYNNEFFFISGFERSYYPDHRISLDISYGEGKIITGRTESLYKNNLLTEYNMFNTYSGQTKTTLYEYNSLKDMIVSETFREDNILLSREDFDLEYDEEGNWIKRILFRTENTQEIYNRKETMYIREITYYEDL